MKTIWKLATCVAVVLLSFTMYSCGDDDEDSVGSVEALVGMWEGVTSDEWYIEEDGIRKEEYGKDISNERYELKSDMTFNIYYGGKSTPSETGKWEFKKGAVHLIYYYPNDGGYDYEEPDIMKILELNSDKLIWEFYSKEPGLELYIKESFRKISSQNQL